MLESSEAALQEVRQRHDQGALARLQRFLHTLKGGARMAGVPPMGDLSHALETLLSRIEGSDRAAPAALDLVQRGIDELQHMRDAIDTGRAISPAAGLVAQLERFDAERAAAASAPGPTQRGAAPPRALPSGRVCPRSLAAWRRARGENGSLRRAVVGGLPDEKGD